MKYKEDFSSILFIFLVPAKKMLSIVNCITEKKK